MFYVFAGDRYYPRGGLEDLYGSFSSYEEAKDFAENLIKEDIHGHRRCEWYHIGNSHMNMIKSKWLDYYE